METKDKTIRKMSDKIIVGYWISEKKRQKFNWSELENVCHNEGVLLKLINLNSDLEPQGPFDVFLHKLTDILAQAENNDKHATEIVNRIKMYINHHSELVVIDPLENVKNLRCRHISYDIIKSGIESNEIFVPHFAVFDKPNISEMIYLMQQNQVTFPIVCKPVIAHGSSDAHKMMIVFNENGLKDCQLPCVAQEVVNHSAILYKVFVVGEKFYVVQRPSLKNFYQKDCETMDTIFFSSHDISTKGSESKWSIISEDEQQLTIPAKHEVMEQIVKSMRKAFGLVLVGIDVVVENHTGRHAIIDINVFPAYDGYPNFFKHLVKAIKNLIKEKIPEKSSKPLRKALSNDLDSGFESDEKKNFLID